MLGEATLDVSGTFLGEAIRLLILFAAQHQLVIQARYFSINEPDTVPVRTWTGVSELRNAFQEHLARLIAGRDGSRPRNRRASLAEQARAGSARACRRNQVRTCFAAGGRWIRTIGPPRLASSVGEPCHATSGGVRGTGLGSAVDRAFSCTASHSMQPGAYTVFTGGGLPCCAAVSASWR